LKLLVWRVLIWFWLEWLRGFQDFGDSGVLYAIVLGAWFSSIPSVSTAEEFYFSQCPTIREGGV
jgi:hypothetical protein